MDFRLQSGMEISAQRNNGSSDAFRVLSHSIFEAVFYPVGESGPRIGSDGCPF